MTLICCVYLTANDCWKITSTHSRIGHYRRSLISYDGERSLLQYFLQFIYSPLWKRVIAWVESSCPSDCGKVWGDVGYCHRIQRPPKQSHNHLDNYSRPRSSLIFKVGYTSSIEIIELFFIYRAFVDSYIRHVQYSSLVRVEKWNIRLV